MQEKNLQNRQRKLKIAGIFNYFSRAIKLNAIIGVIKFSKNAIHCSMRKLWEPVQVKVFLGYFFLIVIASFTIWLMYNEIVRWSIKKTDENPLDEKVMQINSILTDLYQAEGLERTYAQTGDYNYYRDYEITMDTIYQQLDTLQLLSDTKNQFMHTDSIRRLFDRKRSYLKDLVAIKKTGSSDDLYRNAMLRLTCNKDSIDQYLRVYKKVITNRDSVFIRQKKKNFLNRLIYVFSPQENEDSTLQVNVNQTVQLDSILKTINPTDSIMMYLSAIMEDIRNESKKVEMQLTRKEQEVLANNQTITLQLRQMLSSFENEEILGSFVQLRVLQGRIRKTTWYIIALGMLAVLAIVVFLVLILKDISRSRLYRQKLEKAKEFSDSLLKSKEQFMLSITHDLKSPLGSIIGYTRLMHKTNVAEQKDAYLENINKASEDILKLINDLVDLIRLDTGKLKINPMRFNLRHLVDEIFSGFYPIALSRNLEFRLDYAISTATDYRSDPVRLKQVLANLISNALKFTDKGNVLLRVYRIENYGNTERIGFDIADTGIGISEKDKKLIFNEFSRGTFGNNRQYEGAGLGLTISKRIVLLLNGSISVKSNPGAGSLFTVQLPLEKCDNPVRQKQVSEQDPDLKDKHVLLIDDDETLLNMISEVLENSGIHVQKFNSPLNALKFIENNTPDIILTDLHMPGMNGIDLIKQVDGRSGRKIPVIAVTGKDTTDPEKYLRAGFRACIYKPFQPSQLLENIRKVLKGEMMHTICPRPGDAESRHAGKAYDLEQIRQFAEYDEKSVRQILSSFVHTSLKHIELLRSYINEKDYRSMQELAHKMLSMFRQIEAHRVTGFLLKIEEATNRQLTAVEWNLLVRKTLKEIEEVIELIRKEQHITLKV